HYCPAHDLTLDSSTAVPVFFSFSGFPGHRVLHSFPTRRSSDLYREGWKACANSVMTEVQATKNQLERLRNAAFQSTLRESGGPGDRKSTRLNSSHVSISYAVFCLKKKKQSQKGVRLTRTTNKNR